MFSTTNNLETSELYCTNFTTHSKGYKCLAKNITSYSIYFINWRNGILQKFRFETSTILLQGKVCGGCVWFIVHMHGIVHKFLKGCSFDVTTIRSAHMWAVQNRRRRRRHHMHQKGQCNILCTNSPSMANQKLQFRIVIDVILSFSSFT